MNALAFLLLAQAPPVVGTVPVRNSELDTAHACLVSRTERWFRVYDYVPDPEERWSWATKIASGCKNELEAASESRESVPIPSTVSSVSKRNMLRTEALYFVDRLIAEHFEGSQ